MKLGFDMDEIVVKTTEAILKFMEETYGLEWVFKDFTTYSLENSKFVEDERHNKKIAKDLVELVNSPEFQLGCGVYEDAAKSIRSYKKSGHSVHFITTRPRGLDSNSIKWLRKHNIPFNSMHHVGHGAEKGLIGRNLALDFYIDDRADHLKSMATYKKRWRKGLLLMDRPYNRDDVGVDYIRVYNWEEVNRHLGVHKR